VAHPVSTAGLARPSLPRRDGRFFMRRQLSSIVSLAALCLAALAGCARRTQAPSALEIVDDQGDTVRLARTASRIVSLSPASTELLFSIGAGGSVVGRTRWCDYPAEAAAVPSVGDGIQPSVEAVVARQPDLVVLYKSAQNESARQQLTRLGIATVVLALDRLEEFEHAARLLGTLSGHRSDADTMVAGLNRRLAEVTVSATASAPSVLILVWDQPPMTIGAGSFLSDIVSRAGARNLFADLAASAGVISVESVVARKPDLILVTSDNEPAFAGRPEWQTVPAVRNRRFVRVHSSAFNRPSPRMPAAIAELTARLREAVR
jgi:ABC-type Fe3+-hydroxamate transport system substrate-binding protein